MTDKMRRYRSTEKGKEANKRCVQRWREKNPEKVKEYIKNYRQTDHYKELKKEQNRRYREKIKQKKSTI